MKKFLIIVSFFCTVLVAKSQNLTVEGTAPNLYITHTVAPKENFYSVGRLYNQSAKSIASFNNLVMEKGLTIGQHIKIPLNAQNLDVSGKSNSGETVPLTHVVAKSETLSKIGADLNVSAQTIKQWNNLSSDNIAPGTPLVVGHLKMSSTSGVTKAPSNTPVNNQPPAAKQEPAVEVKKVITEPKKEETVTPVAQTPAAEKKETAPAVKQEPVKQTETVVNTPAKETPVKVEETRKSETYSYSTVNNLGSIEGVFANVFTTDASQKSLNTKSGEAATFKSTSGWQDKKYYVLMNDIVPGTIVKIASTENKVVYAKVLGSMPDMKENSGLLMRISNAAASYLGIIDPKFPVQISYYQ
ncbi:MAG: LysM peptidoglycan-binding protein [Segetibacter sp.]|nr:LysM peptidoglycan-binding protein [Segetibacter sp.]